MVKDRKSQLKHEPTALATRNLFTAIRAGNPMRVERALIAGANPWQRLHPNIETSERPLDLAAQVGNLYILDLLLRYGAPVNMDERGGTRALAIAQMAGHPDVEQLLRVAGATDGLLIGLCFTTDFDRVNQILLADESRCPEYALDAVRAGNVEMVQDNLANNPYITPQNDGFALARSAIFQWRLVHKWSVDGFDRARFQVIHHLLLDWGVDPNAADERGMTLLHQCAYYGKPWSPTEDERIAHAKLLVHRGADLTRKDSRGFTPRELAIFSGHHRLSEMLA